MAVSFTGLSSGLDTDAIINELMKVEARPIERYEERIEETESLQGNFRDFNNRVSNLLNTVEDLAQISAYEQMKLDNSHPEVLNATVVDDADANTGTYEIYVEELAKQARRTSGTYLQNQVVAGESNGKIFTSVSDFSISGGRGLDPGDAYLDALRNEVGTTGSGNWDIEIERGGSRLALDLDSVENFQELFEIVNNFDTGHAAVVESSGTAQTFGMQMQYDSAEDRFLLFPGDQATGDDSFILRQNQAVGGPKGFWEQIGFTLDSSDHTFDLNQQEIGQNIVNIDPSATFETALFNIESSSPEAINQGDSGIIRIHNQDIFWSTEGGPASFEEAGFADERADASPVNGDDPVRSINQLIRKITNEIEGISAGYNSATDKIRLTVEEAGAGDLRVRDLGSGPALALNLNLGDQSSGQLAAAETTSGNDTRIIVDGEVRTSSKNSFSFGGIKVDVSKLHTTQESEPVEIKVGQDEGAPAETVRKFVEQYNSLIGDINEKSTVDVPTEPGASGEMRNSGPFVGQSIPRNLRSRLIRLVTDRYRDVSGSSDIQSMSDLGIELVDPLYSPQQDRGKLEFDEAKFRAQMEENSAAVKNFFTAEKTTDKPAGLALNLESYLEGMTNNRNGIIPNRIEGFDTRINDLQSRIDRQMDRVQRRQENLQRQFMRMETLMAQLQQQEMGLHQNQ